MRKARCSVVLLASLAVLGLAGVTRAQEGAQPKKPITTSEAVVGNWNYVGSNLITMAEDWPEEKYGYQPNASVRTFQQVLPHVAGSNCNLLNQASGSKMGDGRNGPPIAECKTKVQVVEFLKKSVADGAAEIKKEGDAGIAKHLDDWIGYTEHMGEHYDLLVAYYRINGVVPPASRRKK
jgi:hypothetical protein